MFCFSRKRIPYFRQWLAGLQVLLIVLVLGTNVGWTCPFMGRLTDKNFSISANKYQISWVASLVNLMRPVGNLLGAYTNVYFGCKISIHIFSTIYYLLACISLVFATSIEYIYLTQIFSGIGLGSLYTIFLLYIAEIASDNMRGPLTDMIMQGYLIGVVAGNLMGAYIEPWAYAVVNIVLSIIYVFTFFLFPETPTRLLLQNKPEKALQSLQWYHEDIDVDAKFQELAEFIKSKPELKLTDTLKKLASPVNRRVMLILFITYGLLQFSGIYTILEYCEIIFRRGGVNVMQPAILVVVMGALGIPGCWIAMYTTNRFGRTVMLCFSCILFSAGLLALGINFQLLDLNYDIPQLQWIIIVGALIFRLSMSVGIMGVPQIIVGELLAPDVKYVGACFCSVFSSICSFISNKNFQEMVDIMTYKNVFFLLSAVTFVMGMYTIIYVPETKGMSLPEIQKMLEKRFSKDKSQNKSLERII